MLEPGGPISLEGRAAGRGGHFQHGRRVVRGVRLVDEAPKAIKEGIERDEAEKLKAELEEAGGSVELE